MCPKSYYAICNDKKAKNDKDYTKIASKGVSKKTNTFYYDQYKKVCYDNATFNATNFSIRKQGDQMQTRKQLKRGLAGVHVKNEVQEDRVTTIPHKRQRMNL